MSNSKPSTVKVKLLANWATPQGNHLAGDIVEVDLVRARHLVDHCYAEACEPLPKEDDHHKPEHAALDEAHEHATKKK
jgi:hypothetical protein